MIRGNEAGAMAALDLDGSDGGGGGGAGGGAGDSSGNGSGGVGSGGGGDSAGALLLAAAIPERKVSENGRSDNLASKQRQVARLLTWLGVHYHPSLLFRDFLSLVMCPTCVCVTCVRCTSCLSRTTPGW